MAERHYSFLEHEEMTNETKQRIYYCVHDGAYQYTCDGTEIITRGEAAELLYALLTKTFAVVPPPMLDNIPLDNKAGVALNNYLLEIQKFPNQ